ncbi:bifunctional heptose 7-phosphate kinase/heptose 1-phosphate adenyltransferase [Desulfoplanes formicivorans]|uniref:ADP-heptose synthase n=1 Tax=Desulfoplanes formicivorans TaxID=1592317 RepID=A0A194AI72_9BACT|nr:PfkB family carbohydrate kinase [Desulfoplanes formicivorans]GAU08459.1 ADP-heptose synthase [Desulfoplanes formicivorans]
MDQVSKTDVLEGLKRLQGKPVLIVGDCMLDHYQWGCVDRISPEAPVPVVQVERESWNLGGAGNVARNIRALGGNPCLVSLVGDDAAGKKIAQMLDKEGIHHHLVTSLRPTTIKTRIIAANQQMLRVDQEKKQRMSSATWKRFASILASLRSQYQVAVVSDYGKGVISEELLESMQHGGGLDKVLVDPKIESYPMYKGHYIMTPNAKEAGESAHGPMGSIPEILEVGTRILKDKQLDNLLITLGSRGMALFRQGQPTLHIPTVAQNVYDVTGAGDTVIGVLALCLSSGLDLLTSCVIANCAAGIVVGHVGTASVSPEKLAASLESIALPRITPWE